jgi:2-oxo-4-hydroxy-4-carboxy-5-ureidoimidazoline decarboxylase
MATDCLISRLNGMDEAAFVEALQGIYEHSPWVAVEAWPHRPFLNTANLFSVMQDEVMRAGRVRQLALVRAHPILGAAKLETLTKNSQSEQQSAQMDTLNEVEAAEFRNLNDRYLKKFGFPFILAVKGKSRQDIRCSMEERIENHLELEFERTLAEIGKIARLRLDSLSLP